MVGAKKGKANVLHDATGCVKSVPHHQLAICPLTCTGCPLLQLLSRSDEYSIKRGPSGSQRVRSSEHQAAADLKFLKSRAQEDRSYILSAGHSAAPHICGAALASPQRIDLHTLDRTERASLQSSIMSSTHKMKHLTRIYEKKVKITPLLIAFAIFVLHKFTLCSFPLSATANAVGWFQIAGCPMFSHVLPCSPGSPVSCL